jgi:hypothetical protein
MCTPTILFLAAGGDGNDSLEVEITSELPKSILQVPLAIYEAARTERPVKPDAIT